MNYQIRPATVGDSRFIAEMNELLNATSVG